MSPAPTRIAIAVVEKNGSYLVGERPSGKPLAGYAEFPGGRVEVDETPEQAAVRECFEETGVSVNVSGRYDEQSHDYAHDRVHLFFFACDTETEEQPRPPFRWVSRSDLRRLEFPEANRALLDVLLKEESVS